MERGVTGYTARWYDGNTLTTGALYDNGTKVGIGTPVPEEALHVVGSIKVDNNILLDEDQKIYFEADNQSYIESNSADRIRLVAGGSTMMTWDQDNSRVVFGYGKKVYIGNNNNALPTRELEVDGDIAVAQYIYHYGDNDTYIRFAPDLVNIVAGGWSALKFDKSTSKIQLNNSNQDLDVQVMGDDGGVILHTDAGTNKVGIGNAAPGQRLSIVGLGANASSSSFRAQNSTNSAFLEFEDGGYVNLSNLRFNKSDFLPNNTDYTFKLGNSGSAGTLGYRFRDVAGTVLMDILNTGKVGIGTTNPGTDLEVYKSSGLTQLYVNSGSIIARLAVLASNQVVVGSNSNADFWIQRNGVTKITVASSAITLADDTTVTGGVVATSTIQVSRSSASPLFQVTDADAGGGAKSRWFGLVDGTSRFAIYGTNGSTEEFNLADGGAATFTGAVTANAGINIDNININGTTIALSSGDLILDAAGDILLDADGGDVYFKDAGSTIAKINMDNSDFTIQQNNNDKDIIFKGYDSDGGGLITALTLDMSDAGTAIFNHDITLPDNGRAVFGGGSDLQVYHDGSNSHIKNTGSLYIASETSGDLYLRSDDDIFIQPQGGENGITLTGDGAVTLYHDNAVKLATTSTGVTVTGALTAAGSAGNISTNASGDSWLCDRGSAFAMGSSHASGSIAFWAGNANKLNLSSAGHLYPQGNGTKDLGLSGNKWKQVYTSVLKTTTILDTNDSAGTNGQVLVSTGAAIDWKTLSEISGVDGTGTAGYLSKWTDADTIGNSPIYTDGTDVAIGSTAFGVGGTQDLSIGNPGTTTGGITLWSTTSATHSLGFGDANSGTARYEGYVEYSHGDNSMRLATSHAERVRIISDGNVGIGTTAPTAMLDVRRGDTSGKVAEFHQSAGYGIDIGSSQADAYISSGYLQNLIIKTNPGSGQVERIRIDKDGKVGIGTNAPESLLTLQNDDAVLRIRSNTATTKGLTLKYNHAGSYGQLLVDHQGVNQLDMKYYALSHVFGRSDGLQYVTIDSSGKVGIGTTAPAATLHTFVSGGPNEFRMQAHRNDVGQNMFSTYFSRGTSASPTIVQNGDTLLEIQPKGYDGANYHRAAEIDFQVDGTPGTNDMPGRIMFWTTADGASAPTERMRITSTGNVGIGTTAPGAKLEVRGATETIPNLGTYGTFFNLRRTDGHIGLSIGIDSSTNHFWFQAQNSTSPIAQALILNPKGGSVGIGTTAPGAKLNVAGGAIRVDNTASTVVRLHLNNSGTNDYASIYADTAAAYKNLILNPSGGKVGIGTTAPATLLHVRGAYSSGSVPHIRSEDSTDSSFVQIYMSSSNGGYLETSSGKMLRLAPAGSTKMVVLTDGNVGIGTTSPGRKLDVDGRVLADTYGFRSDSTLKWYYFDNYSGSNFIGRGGNAYTALYDTGTQSMVWKNGKVGIGADSPESEIDVRTNTTDTTFTAQVRQLGTGDATYVASSPTGNWRCHLCCEGSSGRMAMGCR